MKETPVCFQDGDECHAAKQELKALRAELAAAKGREARLLVVLERLWRAGLNAVMDVAVAGEKEWSAAFEEAGTALEGAGRVTRAALTEEPKP